MICGEILDVYVYQFSETAKKQNKIRFLDLRDQCLIEILPEVFQLTNLKKLSLSYSQIEVIPPEIGQLTNLIGANLAFNQIRSLPNELFQLINLEVLNLEFNLIRSLSNGISQLSKP